MLVLLQNQLPFGNINKKRNKERKKEQTQYHISAVLVPNSTSANLILILYNSSLKLILCYFRQYCLFLLNFANKNITYKPQQNCCVPEQRTAVFLN